MPVTYQYLTDRSIAPNSAITNNTLVHIVFTGDTSQNPDGSSYKATLSQLSNIFGFTGDTFVTGGTYSAGTATFTNNTGGTFNVTGFNSSDIFVTGGTYSAGTATFTNNTGGTFNVTGFTSGNTNFANTDLTFTGNRNHYLNNNYLYIADSPIPASSYIYLDDGAQIVELGLGVYGIIKFLPTETFLGGPGLAQVNLYSGITVFNDAGYDVDFKIKSDSDSNMFVVDGGTNRIGISTASPQEKFHVEGNALFQSITGTSATFSGTSQSILTVKGSGSTLPLMSVQGSYGELFTVYDNLIGSLFSVNDISGLPILEVFSDNTILMGSFTAPSLNTTVKVSASTGTTNVYSIPTSAYTGAFFDYTVSDGTNLRAGNIMSIWSGTSVNITETQTTSFGSTTGITFNMTVSGSNAILRTSGVTGNWTVNAIIRSI